MKELQKEFIGKGEVKGFNFKQIKATEDGYIYSVDSGFEVFKKKRSTFSNNLGDVSYPTSKAFGIWAWNIPTLERANEVFEARVAKHS